MVGKTFCESDEKFSSVIFALHGFFFSLLDAGGGSGAAHLSLRGAQCTTITMCNFDVRCELGCWRREQKEEEEEEVVVRISMTNHSEVMMQFCSTCRIR